ncbi:MAG TPA: S-layer homology domain-containing protein [Acidimicrobiia bacterium]
MISIVPAGPASAANGDTIRRPDTAFSDTSLTLDSAGNPVVAYRREADGLRILHCNDHRCEAGGDSITVPDPDADGWRTSMVLDSQGNPVVAYQVGGLLAIMHCNDPNCAGGNESITKPVGVGNYPSLALDPSGNPVVAYFAPTGDLMLLHCNDPSCQGGNESVQKVGATTPGTQGEGPSVKVDSSGIPVIAFHDQANKVLKVARCSNANCVGASVTVPDSGGIKGMQPSLALDASGRPVVASLDGVTADLRLLHCNDSSCSPGGDSIVVVDFASNWNPSLVLDKSGNPVVAYRDMQHGDLRLLHCDDPLCTGGGDTSTIPDSIQDAGGSTSLVLDGAGNPVVSYIDPTGKFMKILRCDDPGCRPAPFDDVPDSHTFAQEIHWLAQQLITRGCNDANTLYCPKGTVTRGQMAAFLYRALDLTPAPNPFTDTKGHLFEWEIAALAAAGITKGCNPPANTKFCPDDPVTRGQMAAFLARAFGLTGSGPTFSDTDGHLFQFEIARLAAAGITKGCNPPANTKFCPNDTVTREQMAAFLFRGLRR